MKVTRVTTHKKVLSSDKAKALCNSFINSQFCYAPLISLQREIVNLKSAKNPLSIATSGS